MFLTIALLVGIMGQLSNGYKLSESPTSGFSQFFNENQRIGGGPGYPQGYPLESPSSDFSQFFNENQRPMGGPVYKPLESPSSDFSQFFNENQRPVGGPVYKPLESPSSDFNQFFKQDRIVGGVEAEHGGAPYMAGLVVGYTWRSFTCGGSIVSDTWILTAAHCIMVDWFGNTLETFHAVVGSNTWYKGTVAELDSHVIHPYYDYATIKNDLGLLRTREKIQMSEQVAVIALSFEHVGANERCSVTGWGTQWLWGAIPNNLQKLYVNIVAHLECVESVKEISLIWGGIAPDVDDAIEICTFHSPGHGMCHGDSGSPLIRLHNGKQIGIVSWGVPCAIGGPDVFVRVSAYLPWLRQYLKL